MPDPSVSPPESSFAPDSSARSGRPFARVGAATIESAISATRVAPIDRDFMALSSCLGLSDDAVGSSVNGAMLPLTPP